MTGPAVPTVDAGWPGAELVQQGMLDLQAGKASCEALAVAILAQRFRACGLQEADGNSKPKDRS